MKPIDFFRSRVRHGRKRVSSGEDMQLETVSDASDKGTFGEVVRFRPKPSPPIFDPDDDPGPRAA